MYIAKHISHSSVFSLGSALSLLGENSSSTSAEGEAKIKERDRERERKLCKVFIALTPATY